MRNHKIIRKIQEHIKGRPVLSSAIGAIFLGGFYLSFVSPHEYTSESQILIKDLLNQPEQINYGLLNLQPANEDVYILRAIAESPEAAQRFQDENHFWKHLSDNTHIFGLSTSSPFEDYHKNVKQFIQVEPDENNTVIRLKSTAYNGEKAKELNESLINLIKDRINWINQEKANAELEISNELNSEAKANLSQSFNRLSQFHEEFKTVNPEGELEVFNQHLLGLETKRLVILGKLNEAKTHMSPKSIEVKKLMTELAAIDESIEEAKKSIPSLNSSIKHQQLKFDITLWTELFKNSSMLTQNSKLEHKKDAKLVVVLSAPSTPEVPSFPVFPKHFLNLIIMSLVTAMIVQLIMSTLKRKHD